MTAPERLIEHSWQWSELNANAAVACPMCSDVFRAVLLPRHLRESSIALIRTRRHSAKWDIQTTRCFERLHRSASRACRRVASCRVARPGAQAEPLASPPVTQSLRIDHHPDRA